MSRPGIEPVTSRSPERTLYQLSYRGRSYTFLRYMSICLHKRLKLSYFLPKLVWYEYLFVQIYFHANFSLCRSCKNKLRLNICIYHLRKNIVSNSPHFWLLWPLLLWELTCVILGSLPLQKTLSTTVKGKYTGISIIRLKMSASNASTLKSLKEPSHEIMVLFILHKLIFPTCMRSQPMGLDVWFLVRPFIYFHTSWVRTAKALVRLLVRLCRCAGLPEPSLVAYVISTIISWAGSKCS